MGPGGLAAGGRSPGPQPAEERVHRAGGAVAQAFGHHRQELMRGINHLSAYRVTFKVVGME